MTAFCYSEKCSTIMAVRSVLYSADLIGCEALSAFAPDRIAAAFVSALERAGGGSTDPETADA